MGKIFTSGVIIILVLALVLPVLVMKIKRKDKMEPETSKIVRQPAVAGSFYPADSKELGNQITTLINQSEKISGEGKLRILIVPHAGIQFSGSTAAAGFKQIEGQDYRRLIILGASHRAWFDHAAVFVKGAWETPLGKVEIDKDLANNLINQREIIADENPHKEEHSLEIELIFLQKVLPNFKIVPILVSQTNEELINNLAQKIAKNFDEETLLVVSTDLSHYPPYEVAKKVDNQTIGAILSGEPEKFEQTVSQLESAGFPGLETAICGHEAVKIALKVGQILGVSWQKIKYENSGDTAGEKSQVVGYAAIGGWSKSLPSAANKLDEVAQKEALEIARKTLEEHLTSGKIPDLSTKNPQLNQFLGCFVTLRKNGQLRGCIGEFEPKEPLYKVIQKMAIAAATEDFRFPPVTAEELKDIKIEISVMTPKRKIQNWQEIQLGKHGVVIQKGLRSGTFLPQVATETGWTKEEFLSQLCWQKAGLPPDCYKDPSVNLYVFEAQVFEED
ncbi:MAG: AmmeMemoRadiSam system protein B [Microgenomates group bacterium]